MFTNFSVENGLNDPRVRDLTWQNNGDLWLATEGGVIDFEREISGIIQPMKGYLLKL